MKTLPRIGAVGAAVALAAAAAVFATTPAGAAGSFSSSLTGALNLSVGSVPIPGGSMVSGDYDPDAGTLTGNVSIAGGSTTVNVPGLGDADINFSFDSGGAFNGTVDADGNVAFTDTQTMNLLSALGGSVDLSPCSVGPLTLDYTGTYNPDTGDVDVTSNTVSVPATEGTCGGLGSTIDGALAGATVSAHLMFNIGAEGGTAPTDKPTTTEPGTTTPGTTTPGTTVPSGDEPTINGFVTNGCELTASITFTEAGDYTLQVVTNNDRVIGSTEFTRDAAGDADIDVSVDPNHGTRHGDDLNVQLLDADGNVVAEFLGSVDDPDACAPAPAPAPAPTRPLVTPTAGSAKPVSGQPAYTG